MGEYAKFKGHQIKIGTCESMYYLRADQADSVRPQPGNVDPIRDAKEIRFRFPFPDEDLIWPGEFKDYDRALFLWEAVTIPESVKHHTVQFTARGYNVCLPCPESGEVPKSLTVHRNAFPGYVGIYEQRVRNGYLALVCKCGGCGTLWRYETIEEAASVIAACRKEAERLPVEPERRKFWNEIAERIVDGYTRPLPWEKKKATG